MSAIARSEPDGTAGFTLIEVLVALAILAVSVMSIGALVAVNMRSARALEQHLALVSVARAVENGLPDSLPAGPLTGTLDGHPWRADIAPFAGVAARDGWLAQAVAITVSSSGGARFRLDSVHVQRRSER